jgi:hypothetical protein
MVKDRQKKTERQYYNGRLIRTGENGGKYILINGNKKYITNLSYEMCFG